MTQENEWWWALKAEAINSEDDSINLHPYGGDDGDFDIENFERYTEKIIAESRRRTLESVRGMVEGMRGEEERDGYTYDWETAIETVLEKLGKM